MKRADRASKGLTSAEIAKRVESNKGKLNESFGASFAMLCDMFKATNSKGQPVHCYISFLRSSVVVMRPLFRLDFYDEKDRLDLTECGTIWDTSFLTDSIYTDIPMQLPPVAAPDDLTAWEIESLWITESEKYFVQIGTVMHDLVDAVRPMAPEIRFYYGEYMDMTEQL